MSQDSMPDQIALSLAKNISSVSTDTRYVRELTIQKMLKDHRTCQQSVMRFFMEFVEAMALNGSDLRNEASVELAKAIMEIDSRKRILPYV